MSISSPTFISPQSKLRNYRSKSIVQDEMQMSILAQARDSSNLNQTHTTVKRLQERIINNTRKNLFLPSVHAGTQNDSVY